jgi:crotonobetainyl-CoA:carnitine CoA-transferase CaiB-like acyl-CoA transferase
MRTNGVGLPGYRAGWFRLRNGEKALAFVTDVHRVTYLRTTDGYSVLLSVEQPQQFASALQALAGARP